MLIAHVAAMLCLQRVACAGAQAHSVWRVQVLPLAHTRAHSRAHTWSHRRAHIALAYQRTYVQSRRTWPHTDLAPHSPAIELQSHGLHFYASVHHLGTRGASRCVHTDAHTHAHTQADAAAAGTPAMQQYWSVRGDPQYAGCIVLYQMGQFLEAFFTDAGTISEVLGIAHTHRGTHMGAPIPMAGVPVFTQDAYVSRLVRAGYRVVLCEQLEGYGAHGAARTPRVGGLRAAGHAENSAVTGIMRRAVTRVVTRGTILEEALLAPKAHNYVAAVSFVRPPGGDDVVAALAWADVSTGDADVRVCAARELPSLLAAVAPVELVVPVSVRDGQQGDTALHSSAVDQLVRAPRRSLGEGPDEQQFDAVLRNMQASARSWQQLQRRMSDPSSELSTVALSSPLPQLQLPGLDTTENCQVVAWQASAFNAGSSSSPDLAARTAALSGLDSYLRWTLRSAAPPLRAAGSPSVRSQGEPSAVPLLALDAATRRSLEIVRPMNGRRRARGCLLHAIDSCSTAMGSRLLDVRLCSPLAQVQVISARHDAVQFLVHHADLLRVLRARLGAIPDVERCFQRLQTGRGSMPDLIALRDALARAQWIGAMMLTDDVVLFNNSKAVQLDATTMQTLTTLSTVRDAMLQASRFFDSMHDAASATPLPNVLRYCAAVLVAPQSRAQLQSMMTAEAESLGMIHLQRLAIAVHELWCALEGGHSQDQPPAAGVGATSNSSSNESAVGARFGQPTIRAGYSAELDEWRRLRDDSERSIAQLQGQLRAVTGIAALRVKRSEDKGIIVEVPARSVADVDRVIAARAQVQLIGRKGDATQVDDIENTTPRADFHLRHVRTMKSTTRYTCSASERLQADILRAAVQVDALEAQIMQRLQSLVTEAAPAITAILRSLAVLDVSAGCAFNAVTFGMVRPDFVDRQGVQSASRHSEREPVLSIRGARHLVVERALLEGWHASSDDDLTDAMEQAVTKSDFSSVQDVGPAEPAAHPRAFVPNDVVLGAGDEVSRADSVADARLTPAQVVWRATSHARTIILSGPNMGGKSTYLRQIAHCVLLAQMGSFVPAESAQLSVVDKLFTRIGAADDLTRDRSTFLVEMEETAHILRNATSNSLVLVDEVGRGTASVDGLALAWSILEHLVNVVKCRTIFATHMHELTAAAVQLERRTHESGPPQKATLAERINPAIRCMTMLVNVTERGPILTHRIALHPLYAAMLDTERNDGDPWHNVINMSFGVHVARMAGVPAPVLARASAILQHLDASRAPAAWARAVAEIDTAMPPGAH